MTQPDETQQPDDENDGTGVTGALGAASQNRGDDPLTPLDRVADDDEQ